MTRTLAEVYWTLMRLSLCQVFICLSPLTLGVAFGVTCFTDERAKTWGSLGHSYFIPEWGTVTRVILSACLDTKYLLPRGVCVRLQGFPELKEGQVDSRLSPACNVSAGDGTQNP